ncbi:MAG: SGNH/GDSL hydrolase family protein, partial [Phycisphaeraceae bacterium]|nr:SGNH/GDSL hydrolase family protein [Phycisphaeraceae bacterium]
PTGLLYDEARQVLTAAAAEVCAQMNVEFHDLARVLHVEGADWPALLNDDGFHLSKLGFMAYAQFAANLIRRKMDR